MFTKRHVVGYGGWEFCSLIKSGMVLGIGSGLGGCTVQMGSARYGSVGYGNTHGSGLFRKGWTDRIPGR